MKKEVYFIELNNLTPHIETSFEISLSHLSLGDRVNYYFWGHKALYKESIFPANFSFLFPKKNLPEVKAAKLINHENFYYDSKYKLVDFEKTTFKYSNIEELKELTFQNFDIGMAVASSLISLKKDSNPCIKSNKNLIDKMLESGVQIYLNTIELLSKYIVDLVYIFNGRFCNQRAILRACEKLNIKYKIHERGANKDLYFVRDFMPHNKELIQKEMLQSWELITDKNKAKEVAIKWFLDRRSGIDTDWFSYSKNQEKNYLPNFEKSTKIITYFHSSDDEYAAIGDQFKWKGWIDQFDAVVNLIKVVDSIKTIKLVIRLHPHMIKKSIAENLKWKSLIKYSKDILIINPESKIDSYALVENSDIILSSGSKIGIESVFLKKPSILLGPSPYDSLLLTYPAHSIEDLTNLLTNKLNPIDNDNLYKYGYWWATHGDKFIYYKPLSLTKGKFLGVDLQKKPILFNLLIKLKQKIYNYINE
jgi:hypothetical protein